MLFSPSVTQEQAKAANAPVFDNHMALAAAGTEAAPLIAFSALSLGRPCEAVELDVSFLKRLEKAI
jgi:hypothetical protein